MLGRAAILPDDGAVQRPAGAAVPEQRGLALVGQADGGEIPRREVGLGDGPRAVRRVLSQRSRGSCSTQPGRG